MFSTVLVTGGSGFIGSHVVDRLRAAGARPRIFDTRPSPWHDAAAVETVIGDVRRIAEIERALDGCGAICHLAAAADVGEVHQQPAWATELNAMGTLNVLEAARRRGVRRVLYASTVWVYSDVDAAEVDEDALLPNPAHLYTAGKLSGELYCHAYRELYGLEPTVVRLGIPYGPRARPAAVIPRFVDHALRGEPLTIAGTGDQERAFVYVEDLAAGIVAALEPRAAGRTYNLGGREVVTVRGLAEIVRDEVAPAEIVHTEGRPADLRNVAIVSDRAERELGWRAATPLREGVRRYAAWAGERADLAPVPAPAAVPGLPERRRVLARRLIAAAGDPVFMGAAAFIAVASAAVSVILGAGDDALAGRLTIYALALLLPLWSLAGAPWPPARRRTQAACAVVWGALSVLALGLLSAEQPAELHRSDEILAVLASGCLTAGLHVLPRRRAASPG
jgi:UDP-glucose 4-epimerase